MDEKCICGGGGWICEQHPDRTWPHDNCAGPGMPCVCNPKANVEWSQIIATAKDSYAH